LRGRGPRRGRALANLGIIKNGALLIADGLIVAVGTRAKIEAHPLARGAERLDVGGRAVLPGFVDSHTHLIHAASRADEYELRITGANYEEIAKRGGGILNSVSKLRAATSDTLKQRARAALKLFAAYGTTTIEAKSGYGLDLASELKILKLHKELSTEQPLDIVSTFLGAHVIPGEFRTRSSGVKGYVSLLIDKFIPEIAALKLAEFCDVFCERGAFNLAQSKQIVALATDYNPGTSPTVSMPMILSLACTQLRMTPAEAITAATINSAYSLGREKQIGSLEVGKLADISIFDVDDYREIPYYFGVNTCHTTIKRGQIIYSKSSLSAT